MEGASWDKTRKLSGLINVKADPRRGTLRALWKQPKSQMTLARYAKRSQESSTVWPQDGCIKRPA